MRALFGVSMQKIAHISRSAYYVTSALVVTTFTIYLLANFDIEIFKPIFGSQVYLFFIGSLLIITPPLFMIFKFLGFYEWENLFLDGFLSILNILVLLFWVTVLVANDPSTRQVGWDVKEWHAFLFATEQLIRGLFLDVFDIFELNYSPFRVTDMSNVAKLFILSLRTYTEFFILSLVLDSWRRWKAAQK